MFNIKLPKFVSNSLLFNLHFKVLNKVFCFIKSCHMYVLRIWIHFCIKHRWHKEIMPVYHNLVTLWKDASCIVEVGKALSICILKIVITMHLWKWNRVKLCLSPCIGYFYILVVLFNLVQILLLILKSILNWLAII